MFFPVAIITYPTYTTLLWRQICLAVKIFLIKFIYNIEYNISNFLNHSLLTTSTRTLHRDRTDTKTRSRPSCHGACWVTGATAFIWGVEIRNDRNLAFILNIVAQYRENVGQQPGRKEGFIQIPLRVTNHNIFQIISYTESDLWLNCLIMRNLNWYNWILWTDNRLVNKDV